MAIGTSGYIESIHTRPDAPKVNSSLYTAQIAGSLAGLVGAAVKVYDATTATARADELAKMELKVNTDIADNTSMMSPEQKAQWMQDYSSNFAKNNPDLYDSTYKSISKGFDKQLLGLHTQIAATNAEVKYDNYGMSMYKLFNDSNMSATELEESLQSIADMNGLDVKKLSSKTISFGLASGARDVLDPRLTPNSTTLDIKYKETKGFMDKLMGSSKLLGSNSEVTKTYNQKAINKFETAYENRKADLIKGNNSILNAVVEDPTSYTPTETEKAIKELKNLGRADLVTSYKNKMNLITEQQNGIKYIESLDLTQPVDKQAIKAVKGGKDLLVARFANTFKEAYEARDYDKIDNMAIANGEYVKEFSNYVKKAIDNGDDTQLAEAQKLVQNLRPSTKKLVFKDEDMERLGMLDYVSKALNITTSEANIKIQESIGNEGIAKAQGSVGENYYKTLESMYSDYTPEQITRYKQLADTIWKTTGDVSADSTAKDFIDANLIKVGDKGILVDGFRNNTTLTDKEFWNMAEPYFDSVVTERTGTGISKDTHSYMTLANGSVVLVEKNGNIPVVELKGNNLNSMLEAAKGFRSDVRDEQIKQAEIEARKGPTITYKGEKFDLAKIMAQDPNTYGTIEEQGNVVDFITKTKSILKDAALDLFSSKVGSDNIAVPDGAVSALYKQYEEEASKMVNTVPANYIDMSVYSSIKQLEEAISTNGVTEGMIYDLIEKGGAIKAEETFYDMLKNVENGKKVGFDDYTKTWTPHNSPEGGTQTIGYGHKLSKAEVEKGEIKIGKETYKISDGIPDDKIQELLKQDMKKSEAKAKKMVGSDWDNIPRKKQLLAAEIEFNVKGGLKGYPTFMKLLKDPNVSDKDLLEQINRGYTNPTTKQFVPLSNRTDTIKEWYNK